MTMRDWRTIPGFHRGRHIEHGDEEPDCAPLFRALYRGGKVLEIGSYMGRSAAWMRQHHTGHSWGLLKPGDLTCIDPWMHPVDWTTGEPTPRAVDTFQEVRSYLEPMGVRMIQAGINRAAVDLVKAGEGQSFALAYIDGAHAAESVHEDIHHAWFLVEPGGYICGDDYRLESVREGVRSWFRDLTPQVLTVGDWPQWAFRKPLANCTIPSA